MKKILLAAAFLAATGSAFAHSRFSIGISVGPAYGYYAPPPPPPVAYYAAPAPGYVWVSGYYYSVGPRRVWRPGYWSRPYYGDRGVVRGRHEDRHDRDDHGRRY